MQQIHTEFKFAAIKEKRDGYIRLFSIADIYLDAAQNEFYNNRKLSTKAFLLSGEEELLTLVFPTNYIDDEVIRKQIHENMANGLVIQQGGEMWMMEKRVICVQVMSVIDIFYVLQEYKLNGGNVLFGKTHVLRHSSIPKYF